MYLVYVFRKCALFVVVRPFGLECCFDEKEGDWCVGAIHVYNDEQLGFAKCPLVLPCQLKLTMKHDEIRGLLGEPQKKSSTGKSLTFTYSALTPKLEVNIFLSCTFWFHRLNSCSLIQLMRLSSQLFSINNWLSRNCLFTTVYSLAENNPSRQNLF